MILVVCFLIGICGFGLGLFSYSLVWALSELFDLEILFTPDKFMAAGVVGAFIGVVGFLLVFLYATINDV